MWIADSGGGGGGVGGITLGSVAGVTLAALMFVCIIGFRVGWCLLKGDFQESGFVSHFFAFLQMSQRVLSAVTRVGVTE